jgi:mRNA-degrading endonuclease YafQ of YafQ-DinJ toxin-antitoxin module
VETTPQFDRDLRRLTKLTGDRIEKLHAVIDALQHHRPLPK